MNELLVNRLRTARTDKNLKQQEVADILGIKPNTLSNWENGRTEPDIDTFVKLCDIYEIDCASLLTDVYAFKRIKSDISLIEYEHIKKYRDLDDHGKEMVDFTLLKEWERSTAKDKNSNKIVSMEVKEPENYMINAAHANDYMNAPEELKKLEEDIMDDQNF